VFWWAASNEAASPPPAASTKNLPKRPVDIAATPVSDNPLMSEPHVCRGLNTCKGNGAGSGNDCAGLGNCATAEKHACRTHNECKGQGGCGENPGENSCKSKGACGVPLSDKAWTKARKSFEGAMQNAGKKIGAAPAKG